MIEGEEFRATTVTLAASGWRTVERERPDAFVVRSAAIVIEAGESLGDRLLASSLSA
jgi:hypothetical protein